MYRYVYTCTAYNTGTFVASTQFTTVQATDLEALSAVDNYDAAWGQQMDEQGISWNEIDRVLVSKTPVSKASERIVFKVITNTGATSWYGDLVPQLRIRASIDAARNDDGFLGGCFAAYSGCWGAKVMSHTNTSTAFGNLRGGPADFCVLVGHGNSGIINTGNGQVTDGTDEYMNLGNQSSWTPYAGQGVPGSRLVLFGCEVASGQAGLNFIQRVANVVRKEVGAWDGLVYSSTGSDPETWGTGNFHVAKPGGRLKWTGEIFEMFTPEGDMGELRLRTSDGYLDLKAGSIQAIHFTPIGSQPSKARPLHFEDAKAISELVKVVDFANPVVFNDHLASILVGQLVLVFKIDNETQMRTFRVLGSRVLQDACFQDTYYFANSKLSKILNPEGIE